MQCLGGAKGWTSQLVRMCCVVIPHQQHQELPLQTTSKFCRTPERAVGGLPEHPDQPSSCCGRVTLCDSHAITYLSASHPVDSVGQGRTAWYEVPERPAVA